MAENTAERTDTQSSRPEPKKRALFRQPLALQWFENGVLKKRCDEERQAGRFELFLDLLYVAILASFADGLAEHPSGIQVVKYIVSLSDSGACQYACQ
jgi:hypothetical protein